MPNATSTTKKRLKKTKNSKGLDALAVGGRILITARLAQMFFGGGAITAQSSSRHFRGRPVGGVLRFQRRATDTTTGRHNYHEANLFSGLAF